MLMLMAWSDLQRDDIRVVFHNFYILRTYSTAPILLYISPLHNKSIQVYTSSLHRVCLDSVQATLLYEICNLDRTADKSLKLFVA